MIRVAQEADLEAIAGLIRALASYERMADDVVFDLQTLRQNLFGPRRYAEVLIAEDDGGEITGFALFFHNFSTFLGKPGIYLEDLYVKPEHRGRGFGKAMLRKLAQLAIERGCGRMEWAVLNWNEPAIDFYRSIGAIPMDQWTVFRLNLETLARLGSTAQQKS